jgi:hypothetical protein
MTRKSITRREFGQFAAPILDPPWHRTLASLSGWNPRTLERLGTPKMPLDERRAINLADSLDAACDFDADRVAQWLRGQFEP